MKKLIFLFALLIPLALNAQVSISKVGDALKFTGLGLGYPGTGSFTVYDQVYLTSIDQLLVTDSKILFVNSASKNILAKVEFSKISDKLGQASAKDYVEHILSLGYITPSIAISSAALTAVDLTTENDTLSTTYAVVGSEIDLSADSYEYLNIYIPVTIADANDVRFKGAARHTSAGTDFDLQIETVSSSDIKIEPEYVELNTDADQSIMLRYYIKGVPFFALYASEGTDGGDDAILGEIKYILVK